MVGTKIVRMQWTVLRIHFSISQDGWGVIVKNLVQTHNHASMI